MSIVLGVLPKVIALTEGEMPDTVTIHRPGAPTANEYGAMVPGADTDTVTKGRISQVGGTDHESDIAGEQRMQGWQSLTVPLAASVLVSDTVTVVSARHGTTKVYTIEELVPASSFAVHRKLIVRPL